MEKKDKQKKLWRKCFGTVISVCKRFFTSFHECYAQISIYVILCSYRSVKYGKMINTEAALYIIGRGRQRNFHYNCVILHRYSLRDLGIMGWIKDLFY